MEKYKNKYRILSHRMPGWDYSKNGFYFITLVTQNRECILGDIVDGKMILSDFGHIVEKEWLKSFEIRDELFLDEYIIMPNHLHAIVVLNNKNNSTKNDGWDGTNETNDLHGLHGLHVEKHGRASLQPTEHPTEQSTKQPTKQPTVQSNFVRKPKSISSFIAGLKSSVNAKIDDFIDENNLGVPKYNRNNHFFQTNYHDHIIRNNSEYERIKEYIINNPFKWNEDKFNPDKKGEE